MIKLLTGLPGSGKSLRLVMLINREIASGRQVFVHGIDGLKPGGWTELVDPNGWEKLPDGSFVVIDEAQKVWGTRRVLDVPPWILALTEHRHRAFDFLLVAQHPTMLDKYVRSLVGEHEHLVRQFGAAASRVYTWSECYDDPQSLATRRRGVSVIWPYPKALYTSYRSASQHTIKMRVPLRVIAIPVMLLVALVMTYFSVKYLHSFAKTDISGKDAANEKAGIVGQDGPGMAKSVDTKSFQSSVDGYIRKQKPRVESQPWSAEIFDSRPVLSEPSIFCVDVASEYTLESGEIRQPYCQCYTEQGTHYSVGKAMCKLIARNVQYDPHRAPVESVERVESEGASSPRVPQVALTKG